MPYPVSLPVYDAVGQTPGSVIDAALPNGHSTWLGHATRGRYYPQENGATDDGVTDDSGAFLATDTANGGKGVTTVAPAPSGYRLAANTTLANALTLPPGALLKPDAGVTVQINGNLDAGPYQVFGGAGTVALTGAALRRGVRPEWWGANGIDAATDTAAWNAALTCGGLVLGGACTYRLNGPLTVAGSTCIHGAGRGVTTFMATALTGDLFVVSSTDHVELSACTITATAQRTSGAAIHVSNAHDTAILDVDMTLQYNGVLIDGTNNNVWIDRGFWTNFATTGVGIWITGPTGSPSTNDHYISNIVMDNPSGAQPAAGIRIQSTGGTWIDNCDIIHSGYGLLVDPQAGQVVQWIFAQNSAFDTCQNNGVHVSGATSTSTIYGAEFRGCWASTCGGDGFAIDGNASATIDGVRIIGQRCYTNGGSGLTIAAPATNVAVSSSTFSGNSDPGQGGTSGNAHGVFVAGGVSGWSLVDCRSGNTAGRGNTQGYGVFVNSGAGSNYKIQGCDLRANVTGGLNNLATGGGVVSGNIGYNPVGYAIGQPAVPASTVAYTNTTGVDCMVIVSGGTVTAIAVGGTATGLTSGMVRVPALQTITLTYSAAPSWAWWGD